MYVAMNLIGSSGLNQSLLKQKPTFVWQVLEAPASELASSFGLSTGGSTVLCLLFTFRFPQRSLLVIGFLFKNGCKQPFATYLTF